MTRPSRSPASQQNTADFLAPASPSLHLTDGQRVAWLRLIRTEGVGPRTFRTLINHCGGAEAALDELPRLARRASAGRPVRVTSQAEAEAEIAAAERMGVRFIALGEPDYPEALRNVDSAPPLLAVRGQVAALRQPGIAMVGSRNASAAGLAMTERLARGLGAQGYCIVSGLARGVDGRAHRSSLATGTIAVLAGGQDRLYPAEHTELAEQIVERGAILSEMPMGWEARGRDFPRRNRIVAGLSLATVVVEAARKSGSLITANFANEQGRIVMAVPGHPLDPRSEGPNDLLAEGASICRGIEDVLAAVSPLARTGQGDLFREPSYAEPGKAFWDELDLGLGESPAPPLSPLPPTGGVPPAPAPGEAAAGIRERLASLLGTTPVPLDDLIRQSGAPAAQVRPIILEMELAGQITRLDGGRIALLIR